MIRAHPQLPSSDIVESGIDGLQWTHPMPSLTKLEGLYTRHYNDQYAADKRRFSEDSPPAFVVRRAQAQAAFVLEATAELPIGDIGESGAGWGALAQALAGAFGRKVLAYDLDPEAVSFMRSRGVDAHRGTLESSEVTQLSLVACSHTLEHMPDPRAALEAILRRLRPGGMLFIEVPLENPVPTWWGSSAEAPYWVGHLVFLRASHLETLARALGLRTLRTAAFDHPASPFLVMPGEARYDLSEVPLSADTTPSRAAKPRFLRCLYQKPLEPPE